MTKAQQTFTKLAQEDSILPTLAVGAAAGGTGYGISRYAKNKELRRAQVAQKAQKLRKLKGLGAAGAALTGLAALGYKFKDPILRGVKSKAGEMASTAYRTGSRASKAQRAKDYMNSTARGFAGGPGDVPPHLFL